LSGRLSPILLLFLSSSLLQFLRLNSCCCFFWWWPLKVTTVKASRKPKSESYISFCFILNYLPQNLFFWMVNPPFLLDFLIFSLIANGSSLNFELFFKSMVTSYEHHLNATYLCIFF
jgi:hypothetical protein